MIITRKIEVFICEDNKELRDEYYKKLYDTINVAVKIANLTVSHLFMLDTRTPYLSPEDREKLTFLGCRKEVKMDSAPYVVASDLYKGKVDMYMASCLIQNVRKNYKEDFKKGMWNRSLRSYKSNLPVPFKSKQFKNLRFEDYLNGDSETRNGCFFTLIGIPFQMRFGRDRSSNKVVVQRVIDGEYDMRTSCIKAEKNKLFLLLCVDIPKQAYKPTVGKKMYASLGVMNPIICTCVSKCELIYGGKNIFEIGTKEEFNYRRRQIQEAVRRCQINNSYTDGKGRKRKTQALERFHDKEKNYIGTKLHTYSRMLVNLAKKHKCSEIVLVNQIEKENKAKQAHEDGDGFVLRNWTYYGLKEMIMYKSKMVGIDVTIE